MVVNDWMDCDDRCRVNVKQFVNDDGYWFAFMMRILKVIMMSFRPYRILVQIQMCAVFSCIVPFLWTFVNGKFFTQHVSCKSAASLTVLAPSLHCAGRDGGAEV